MQNMCRKAHITDTEIRMTDLNMIVQTQEVLARLGGQLDNVRSVSISARQREYDVIGNQAVVLTRLVYQTSNCLGLVVFVLRMLGCVGVESDKKMKPHQH